MYSLTISLVCSYIAAPGRNFPRCPSLRKRRDTCLQRCSTKVFHEYKGCQRAQHAQIKIKQGGDTPCQPRKTRRRRLRPVACRASTDEDTAAKASVSKVSSLEVVMAGMMTMMLKRRVSAEGAGVRDARARESPGVALDCDTVACSLGMSAHACQPELVTGTHGWLNL
jgi:hypothetical protein